MSFSHAMDFISIRIAVFPLLFTARRFNDRASSATFCFRSGLTLTHSLFVENSPILSDPLFSTHLLVLLIFFREQLVSEEVPRFSSFFFLRLPAFWGFLLMSQPATALPISPIYPPRVRKMTDQSPYSPLRSWLLMRFFCLPASSPFPTICSRTTFQLFSFFFPHGQTLDWNKQHASFSFSEKGRMFRSATVWPPSPPTLLGSYDLSTSFFFPKRPHPSFPWLGPIR